jgi:aspartyl/asparaginyl beta-hydroxylase (cupin superfamily)
MLEHNLVRTRIMKMKPKTCYLWHADKTKRLHIPIITHPHCFLLIDNERIHIPATGEAYVIDTTKNHTALNCSKIDRIHIVGAFR